MNSNIVLALIAIVSGGSLTAFINMLFKHMKRCRDSKGQDVDARVAAWQKISYRNDERISQLEKRLSHCDRNIRSLERYILELEQIIVKASLELPERPLLEIENVVK